MSFWGFAPAKASARIGWLSQIKAAGGLAVIFEAPHRATASLNDCADIFGAETPMLYCREMTKQHETIFRGSISEIQQSVAEHQANDPGAAKGEMVWVFDLGEALPITPADVDGELLDRYARVLAAEMPAAAAAKCLSRMLDVSRDAAYQAVLAHRRPT
jgi:16S rRNA (cytidine1402-2'-O)-methyltransferase